jgi:hypothetical protein
MDLNFYPTPEQIAELPAIVDDLKLDGWTMHGLLHAANNAELILFAALYDIDGEAGTITPKWRR